MDNLEDILDVLNNNGIILYPTDTIWGLGCRSDRQDAVEKIFNLKKREKSKPLSVLVSSLSMLHETVLDVHPRIETLLLYHTKPLTLIYKKAKNIQPPLADQSGSLGVRLTSEPFCKKIIDALGVPLVSTSANLSGNPYPKNFKEINMELIEKVDYVVKYRQTELTVSEPSVIAKFNKEGDLDFLRT